MPIKWKIFRIANYLLLLLTLSCTGFIIYFFTGLRDRSFSDISYFFIFTFGGLVLLTNNSLNIYLLERHYPDGDITRKLQGFLGLILVLNCFIIGLLTLLWLVDISDIVTQPSREGKVFTRPRVVAMIVGTILLIAYYVFWMQVALRKTIRRNRRAIYTAFLESN